MKRDLYPGKSIDMDLQLRKIVDTERFGQLPQKVWLAERTTAAYEEEIKQYLNKEASVLNLSNFGKCPS